MALIPITIDIVIRTLNIAENTFASRLITGLILGAMTAIFILPGILSIKFKDFQKLSIAKSGTSGEILKTH